MNTIKYKDLRTMFLDNELNRKNAKQYFGDRQPMIFQTGFYSAPSWNWGYVIGIASIEILASNGDRELDETKTFEVVTRFGQVESAREIVIPSSL